jgi:hypothetical protein
MQSEVFIKRKHRRSWVRFVDKNSFRMLQLKYDVVRNSYLQLIRRGAKFVKELPGNIARGDTALRKTANTLNQIGEYGTMAGASHGIHASGRRRISFTGCGWKNQGFQTQPAGQQTTQRFQFTVDSGTNGIMGTTAAADNAKANRAAFSELPGFA